MKSVTYGKCYGRNVTHRLTENTLFYYIWFLNQFLKFLWISCSKFPGLLNKGQKFLFACSRTRENDKKNGYNILGHPVDSHIHYSHKGARWTNYWGVGCCTETCNCNLNIVFFTLTLTTLGEQFRWTYFSRLEISFLMLLRLRCHQARCALFGNGRRSIFNTYRSK